MQVIEEFTNVADSVLTLGESNKELAQEILQGIREMTQIMEEGLSE